MPFCVHSLDICCDEDIMIRYNVTNVHYGAINAQNFENNRTEYGINKDSLIHKKVTFSILNFNIFIYIYNVRGDIDQLATNRCKYRACCAAVFTSFLMEALRSL